jgi:small subunit ribosomal protein S2
MAAIQMKELLEAGVHFGHQTKRWNPKMKKYIFGARNSIYIIDLQKTLRLWNTAANFLTKAASEGKTFLFVATKPQAQELIAEQAQRCGAFYVNNRWLGGMLTNFTTIRKSIKRLTNIEKMEIDGTFDKITKKERLMLSREKERLNKILSGIVDMNRLPGALIVFDTKKEHIAVDEARNLGIPVIAIVDTNCDPDDVEFPIPGNDDSSRTIDTIAKALAASIESGREKSKMIKAEQEAEGDRIAKENESRGDQ